jgi:hypothetical protein
MFYSTQFASLSAGVPAMCAAAVSDLWFSYTATTNGTAVFTTCTPTGFTTTGTMTNTVIDVLNATCPTPTVIACNDDSCTSRSSVSAPIVSGTTYLVRVGGVATTTTWGFYLTVGIAPANDDCANPTTVNLGANGPFNNHFGTNSAMTASCNTSNKDVFFTFTPICTGNYQIDTVDPLVTPVLDTVLSVYDVCAGVELACDDDSGPGLDSLIASVGLTAGTPYVIRVASFSTTTTGSFSLNVAVAGSGVAWSSPLGPGSVQFDISGGPSFGTYYHAIDFAPNGFPAGWFFGIGIPPQEIFNQIAFGYPFVGILDICGAASFGPVGGLPSGFTLYSVALTMSGPGLTGPASPSAAVSYTIP